MASGFKIRQSKYRHVYADEPKQEVSALATIIIACNIKIRFFLTSSLQSYVMRLDATSLVKGNLSNKN